ncbi:ATP-binding protein [Pseudoxanthomonas dokdonensis]|uniref:histidine kinase n=1 Tax=Pseudoxanthomonas dokdonensis TaxID=344882 RepID=A0A0R0CFU8_9GAMM|nr:ATP-binding protein [Pseudoxanthomonas dokdonensis]KRG68623.1 histidine kinase [Pseudoxanthomonas dokdonensis]
MLVTLIGITSLVLLVAAGFSYRAGLQEAGEMFDAKLAHSSRVLMSLVDEPLSDLAEHPGNPIIVKGWHGRASGVGDALAFQTGHAYETKLAFQVRDAHGRLLLRSDSGPSTPLAPLQPGYRTVTLQGEQWRTFTLSTPSGLWYQSGEESAIREELAEDIALGTLWPLLLALPVIALVVWLAVNWASRSLLRVSVAVAERQPDHLQPIRLAGVPEEISGIVEAVNGLLARLRLAFERERRFTADAAHELRTPLAAIKVHAYNARHADEAGDRFESQQALDACILRMERLVNQMLALGRMEAGDSGEPDAWIQLDDIVREYQRDLAALAGRDGKSITLDLQPVSLLAPATAMHAIVRNLMDNAARYVPAGGEVRVAVDQHDQQARLVIEDSGAGIPPADRERVFERFHRRLGSGAEGSGLGLAIVAQALQRQGGHITLDDSPALGGLRVSVLLPLQPAPAAIAASPANTGQ